MVAVAVAVAAVAVTFNTPTATTATTATAATTATTTTTKTTTATSATSATSAATTTTTTTTTTTATAQATMAQGSRLASQEKVASAMSFHSGLFVCLLIYHGCVVTTPCYSQREYRSLWQYAARKTQEQKIWELHLELASTKQELQVRHVWWSQSSVNLALVRASQIQAPSQEKMWQLHVMLQLRRLLDHLTKSR